MVMAARKTKPIEFDVDLNGCFICTSHALDWDKYPLIKRKGKMIRISRFIYETCFGEIPENHVIRHKCDNPQCINPEHLINGTHKQNSMDMVMRGRSAKGEQNGFSKLTTEKVILMRKMKREYSFKELSEIFGISKGQTKQIIWRKAWKHI